jgi:hypothetical protein
MTQTHEWDDRTRPPHWPVVRAIVVASVAATLTGCNLAASDRVNHLHSDANQKVAEQALGSFAAFTDERDGLEPTLLKNLRSQTAHDRERDDLRVAVDESDLATSLTDKTWDGLRTNLYATLGVTEREVGDGKPETFVRWQRRLDERLKTRYRKVQAAGAVLKALAVGQGAVITQGKANLERVSADLKARQAAAAKAAAGDTAETPPADETSRQAAERRAAALVESVFLFRDRVTAAGERAAERRNFLRTGEELQAKLLDAVRQSRDKATAYALVAVLGTGLSDAGDDRLDAFIRHLASRLADLEFQSPPGRSDADAAWRDFAAAAENARALVNAAGVLDGLARVRLALAEKRPVSLRDAQGLHDAAAKAGLGVSDAAIRSAPADAVNAAVAGYATSLEEALAKWFGGPNAPDVLADALPDIGGRIGEQIDQLRGLIDKLPPALVGKDLSELLAKLKTGDAKSVAREYLHKALASSPALIDRLETIGKDEGAKKEFDANLTNLGKVLKEIDAQSMEATNRVLEFVRDLYRLQVDLDEENLRHFRALSTVASAELKRWQLLSELNARYRAAYPDVRAELVSPEREAFMNKFNALKPRVPLTPETFGKSADPTLQKRMTFRLFPDDFGKSKAMWGGDAAAAARDPEDKALAAAAAHPDVRPGDQIVPTLRRLAATARAWQFGQPGNDPTGRNTQGSHDRLIAAVGLINGQLLMISLNERFALENGLLLHTEVGEHDLHLDAITARTREAGIRLGLRDLAAYHSSGITEADIQAAIGIIQQVLLANIGGKL